MNINLFYLSDARYGGHVTFTVHLMLGLRAVGASASLYKVGKNTEDKWRDFGYGRLYQNISLVDACRLCKSKRSVTLVVATNKPCAQAINAMIDAGARAVIHDPGEFKRGWNWQKVQRPIVIRESMLSWFEDAVFLLHPYDPLFGKIFVAPTEEWAAVSTSRIDFDKHTEILLDANRLLDKKDRIQIYGFENRIYTRFNVVPKYPEWRQSVCKYPRKLRYAVRQLCHKAAFSCDMSIIKGDGGGTQYTFLEAIDAGCALVLNRGWIIDNHVMNPDSNCFAVSDGEQLAGLIKEYTRGSKIMRRRVERRRIKARRLLDKHLARKVAVSWKEELHD